MIQQTTSQFAPRNVLVIGGSSGIGLGFVKYFLEEPSTEHVFAASRNPDASEELGFLHRTFHEKMSLLTIDVTDETHFKNAVVDIRSITPSLDLVIYTVGVLHEGELQPEKSLRQIEPANLLRSFQVNSVGAILAAKHLQPLLNQESISKFVAISAKVGSIGDNHIGGWYGYRAAKAALNMFLKTVSIEYSRSAKNVVVLSLHPGTTDTRLSKPFQRNVPEDKLFSVEKTVGLLTKIIYEAQLEESGGFFSWDGSRLPW